MGWLSDKDRARLWQNANTAWTVDKNPFIPRNVKGTATRKAAREFAAELRNAAKIGDAAKREVERQKQAAILRYALEADW